MEKATYNYEPYFDPDFESLIERIYPPRVCVDNDSCVECTLVKIDGVWLPNVNAFCLSSLKNPIKVDSANKHGILLEMVQVLTDLDLVISKSYISSDGGWFMDVFHVTDQLGNKLTDESLILYIQQALCANRRMSHTRLERNVRSWYMPREHTALEMTGTNRPGLMSEILAVLVDLGCNITGTVAWTHKTRLACIIYMEDGVTGGPVTDQKQLTHIEEQLEMVVDAHHMKGEKRSVRLTAPAASPVHTERRLHQLMYADRDYEECGGCLCGGGYRKGCGGIHVTIESCNEKGYSVVNVRCRDRPKLLFDTVFALTEMEYVVFHAAVGSKGFMADQEYFIRHKDGCTLESEKERKSLTNSLIAAIERRVSQGLRLEICTENRMGQLSEVTRILRQNGLSITRAEVETRGERSVGSFYVSDASGQEVSAKTIELIREEIGGSVLVVKSQGCFSQSGKSKSIIQDDRPRFSLGSLLRSQMERFSSNFGANRL